MYSEHSQIISNGRYLFTNRLLLYIGKIVTITVFLYTFIRSFIQYFDMYYLEQSQFREE
jgi:hypothetical protein